MRFTVGVDIPDVEDQDTTAIGLVIPVLNAHSAADTIDEIESMAIDCIKGVLEVMKESGDKPMPDLGLFHYDALPEYSDYMFWLSVDVPAEEEL